MVSAKVVLPTRRHLYTAERVVPRFSPCHVYMIQAKHWTLDALKSTANRRFMMTHANLKDLPAGSAKGLKVGVLLYLVKSCSGIAASPSFLGIVAKSISCVSLRHLHQSQTSQVSKFVKCVHRERGLWWVSGSDPHHVITKGVRLWRSVEAVS